MKFIFLLLIFLTISSLEAVTTYSSRISSMPLDQKIAQLMIVALCSDEGTNRAFMQKGPYIATHTQIEKYITEYSIGGIIYLGVANPTSIKNLTQKFQSQSNQPLFVCLDAEWGLGMRMPQNVISYPRAMTLGALAEDNDHLIYELGKQIGKECKTIGINWNLAPVADVNNNPKNPIINTRSFGENPHKVASKAWLFARGMHESGIIACAKHFPGYGDVESDPHHILPTASHTMRRLNDLELVPFSFLIQKGIMAIMTAHIALPHIENRYNFPATLSHTFMTSLLKEKMAFDGLIITDSLGMKGITDQYAPGESELKALQAGCDIVLCPVDVEKAIERIRSAVQSGELSESIIDEKIRKISHAKDFFIHTSSEQDTKQLISDEGLELKQKIYESALTLVKRNQLPLRTDKPLHVITCGAQQKPYFIRELEKSCAIHHTTLTDISSIPNYLNKKNLIISIHLPSRSGMIELTEHKELPASITLAQEISKDAVVIIFGNPYNIPLFKDASDILVAYDDDEYAHKAAARIFMGQLSPQGILPVSASDEFPEGLGLHY